MSNQHSPQQPPSSTSSTSPNPSLLHNISILATIACPIIILLPPRKFDTYTIALLSGTFLGGNQLAREYTGRSLVERIKERSERIGSMRPDGIRERTNDGAFGAETVGIRAIRERDMPTEQQNSSSAILDVLGVSQRKPEAKEPGILEHLFAENRPPTWKVERDKREKEALEEGRGYGDLIMDQIWEVWNWGKKDS